ncbi:hypothetical protein [Streptomyces sp. UNOB3_S3]|uniref:hypothetical protein n=1 Tax=Streptomyces sp. UNOB3_S3 TaxID=2871682 RepID=UPI001E644368|nr:hypothetical protein [Streptomyces sp. UNOB3_S3]MCC3775473.1 hypothetical protein [Streptomyces sp. UNOB3_S3]
MTLLDPQQNLAVDLHGHGRRRDHVLLFEIEDGLIHGMYAVRNPDKLGAAVVPRPLDRGRGGEAARQP